RETSTVLDIGAHIGTHTLSLSQKVGPQGLVIAFEPQYKLFTELHENLKLNHQSNVIPLRYAIGDVNQPVTMHENLFDNEGGTPIGIGGDPVIMITLDSLGLKNVSLMKIDIEGSELRFLQGAIETIKSNRPILLIEITCWRGKKDDYPHDVERGK